MSRRLDRDFASLNVHDTSPSSQRNLMRSEPQHYTTSGPNDNFPPPPPTQAYYSVNDSSIITNPANPNPYALKNYSMSSQSRLYSSNVPYGDYADVSALQSGSVGRENQSRSPHAIQIPVENLSHAPSGPVAYKPANMSYQSDLPVRHARSSPSYQSDVPVYNLGSPRQTGSPTSRYPSSGTQISIQSSTDAKLITGKPSMRKSPMDNREATIDALTDQLLKNMESSSDPNFLGVCAKCNKKVVGENNGCNAMDKLYHVSCFTCITCHQLLQGHSFFSMEGKPYCESCYVNTLEKCSVCSKPITDRLLRATGKPYHPGCFTCVICRKSLDGIPFTVDATNQIHCIDDFHQKFAPRCCVCHQPIMPESGQDETVRVVAMDKSFHITCYRCQDCGMLLSSEAEGRGCYPLDDLILCKKCNSHRIQTLTHNIS